MRRRFAIATREEVWVDGRLVEWRLSHGEALADGPRITATDAADPVLVDACEREMKQLRDAMPFRIFDARLVAEASTEGRSASMVLSRGAFSIVTSAEHAAADMPRLERAAAGAVRGRAPEYRGIPILWTGGSAAVLLHEAAGHPAESGAPVLEWPPWLSARDGGADLLAGEPPRTLRRASFRDVPLRRMSEVRVTQRGSPFDLPAERIEVFLVEGGSYEPLTGRVRVVIAAAERVSADGSRRRLPRFAIEETREAVARSLVGAAGEPERYPGVICSSEGHDLFVASYAPLVLTVFA